MTRYESPSARHAAIEQTRDVRMLERREDPALVPKSLQGERAASAGADDLDGDLLLECLVGAGGEIDDAHAAMSELAEDR